MRKPKILPGHPYHALSDYSLRYIITDASEALELADLPANQAKYADQVNDAVTILNWRSKNS